MHQQEYSVSKLSTVTEAMNVLPDTANFCATGIMLPGHSEVCLALVTPR